VTFPLVAELERISAAVSDLMELSVGDVLRTNHRIEKPVNVAVENSVKFAGRLAALEGKMIVQVTEKKQRTAASAAATGAV
jgi:flagellar motor switch protein FliM